MNGVTMEDLEDAFNDHPSLNASLQDFEHNPSNGDPQSPRSFGYPSHHSGFLSEPPSEAEVEESSTGSRYSPPAWRRGADGRRSSGFWNSGSRTLGKRHFESRESSPEYESADDGQDETLAAAARTRLPTGSLSPEKKRSPSPEPYPRGEVDFGNTFGGKIKQEEGQMVRASESSNNCMGQYTFSVG